MSLYEKMGQLAHLEYRAERDVNTTLKNIHKTFGYRAIDLATVQRWFDDFENEKAAKFDIIDEYGSEREKLFSDREDRYLDGMLSQVNIEDLYGLNTFDGRIAYGVSTNEFVVIDLFHGQHKSLPFNFGMEMWDPPEFIDESLFLILDWRNVKLNLYKFDFDVSTLERLDSVQLNRRFKFGYLALDKSDSTKFIVYRSNQFCTGQVIEDRIIIGEVSQVEVFIQWPKLDGSKLQFIRRAGSSSCKLYDFDLGSRTLASIDIKTKFDNGETFDLSDTSYRAYFWSGHHFYISHKIEEDHWKVVTLDTEAREWLDTGVEVWRYVQKLFIDQYGFLTVVAHGLSAFSFHRFALKKPDSLMNLAWFTYTNTFKTTGKRGKLFKKLPYTRDLRLDLPGTEQETDIGKKSSC